MGGVQGDGKTVELIATDGCGGIEVGGGCIKGWFDVFAAIIAANDVDFGSAGCAVENSSCDGHGSG